MPAITMQWTNYQQKFRNSLSVMQRTSDFSDVTLVCEDGEVLAHQLVLSTGSRVFNKMLKTFNNAKHQRPSVKLRGISKEELSWILDYMYTGQCILQTNNVDSFRKKGNLLGLVDIQEVEENLHKFPGNESLSNKLAQEEYDNGCKVYFTIPKSENEIIMKHTTGFHPPFGKYNELINENESKIEMNKDTLDNEIINIKTKEENNKEENITTSKKPVINVINIKTLKQKESVDQQELYNNHNEEPLIIVPEQEMSVFDVILRNSITRNYDGGLLCNYCKLTFSEMAPLREHMVTHLGEFEGMYKPAMTMVETNKWKCLDCGKISPKNHMMEHVEVHVTGLQYVCPDCGIGLKSKNSMRSHMLKSCTKKLGIKCLLCSFRTHSQIILDAHDTRKHSVNHKIKCTMCSYRCYSEKLLENHIKVAHNWAAKGEDLPELHRSLGTDGAVKTIRIRGPIKKAKTDPLMKPLKFYPGYGL